LDPVVVVRDVAVRADHRVLADLDPLNRIDHAKAVEIRVWPDDDARLGPAVAGGDQHDVIVDHRAFDQDIPRVAVDADPTDPAPADDAHSDRPQIQDAQAHA